MENRLHGGFLICKSETLDLHSLQVQGGAGLEILVHAAPQIEPDVGTDVSPIAQISEFKGPLRTRTTAYGGGTYRLFAFIYMRL